MTCSNIIPQNIKIIADHICKVGKDDNKLNRDRI